MNINGCDWDNEGGEQPAEVAPPPMVMHGNKHGFDRRGNCGCEWSSLSYGEHCPHHDPQESTGSLIGDILSGRGVVPHPSNYEKELSKICDIVQKYHPIGEIKAIGLMEAAQAVQECLESDAAKLEFLKSKGLTVGLATESNKEPYLAYVVEPGSELCDLETVNKLIDAEISVSKLIADLRIEYETAVKEIATWSEPHPGTDPEWCKKCLYGAVEKVRVIRLLLRRHGVDVAGIDPGDELIDENLVKSWGWEWNSVLRQWASGPVSNRMRVLYWPLPKGNSGSQWFIEIGAAIQTIPAPESPTKLRSLLAALGVV